MARRVAVCQLLPMIKSFPEAKEIIGYWFLGNDY